MRKISFILALLFSVLGLAQKPSAVMKWNLSTSQKEIHVGDEIEITLTCDLKENWHIYSIDFEECGPVVSTITVTPDASFKIIKPFKAIGDHERFDDLFGCKVKEFKGKPTFKATVKVNTNSLKIVLNTFSQACTNEGMCLPPASMEVTFTPKVLPALKKGKMSDVEEINTQPKLKEGKGFGSLNGGADESIEKRKEDSLALLASLDSNNSSVLDVSSQEKNFISKKKTVSGTCDIPRRPGFDDIEILGLEETKKGGFDWGEIFMFMLTAFGAGLIALITPCMFPMIPMTVNFFTHSSKTKAQSFQKAFVYGFSIIIIYVLIGVLVGGVFNNPGIANLIATHWIPNLIFFAIFIIFAASFLGMFEITLPSSVVNSMDSKSSKGGFIGIFFMAFTLVLVSFSCTGPIAGTILIEASNGHLLKPIMGMLGYSLAFAIPFTLFALFPSWLNKLPKSGGWLNSVKVVLGLVEIALAFKFLSVADLTAHWGIMDREVFLVIWIAVFTVTSLYLFGFIQFPHDSKLEKISVPRAAFGIASLAFVFYMIPGLWGAPLKALSGIQPPMHTQDFTIRGEMEKVIGVETDLCFTPMYSDQLEMELGLEGYFDLREAICCAKEQGKPIFLDFTGHGCVNCRRMEQNVWTDTEVHKLLNEEFVMLALYADDHKIEIPKNERYTGIDGSEITTLGSQSTDFMVSKFNRYGQPFYLILDYDKEKSTDEKIVLNLLASPRGYDTDIEGYKEFLKGALKARKK